MKESSIEHLINYLHLLQILDNQATGKQKSLNFCKNLIEMIKTIELLQMNKPHDYNHYLTDREDSYIYYPSKNRFTNKIKGSVLLVCHELSRTGAPVVLVDAAKVLANFGYFVTILSPIDGPLRKEISEVGIPLIISNEIDTIKNMSGTDELIYQPIIIDRLVSAYDQVIFSSAVLANFIRKYSGTNSQIIWWIHEGHMSFQKLKNQMPETIEDNIHVYCVGEYSRDQLKESNYFYPTKSLIYGVTDTAVEYKIEPTKKTIQFLLVGTFCERKGQLVLAQAIRKLKKEHLASAKFLFVGPLYENDPSGLSIWDELSNLSKEFSNVELRKEVTREELFKFYQKSDVLIVPSLDDPMPVVAAENMLLSKICVCSDMTGTSRYIEEGVNGFVFKANDVEDLTNHITTIINHPERLNDMKQKSRKIYETYFEMSVFEKNIQQIVSDIQKKRK